ncbi:hypothetical protein Tco_0829266 [Tanacetum coccineum]
MSTSNNTTFEFEVHHNGGFKLNPLTYQNGSILNINVLPTDFADMISYLSRKISRRFTTLYYTLPPNNTLSGLKQIKNDYDTNVMYDIAKVAGKIQLFGLWRMKMRALLIHHGCEVALEVLPANMKDEAKAELNKNAHSAVILCLGNKILKEVTGLTTAASVLDLSNIELKFKDEDLTLLLLTYLPASYEQFVDVMLYRRKALNLEDVMAILKSKEIKERSKAKGDNGEGLYVRGKTDRRDSHQLRGKSRLNSGSGRTKFYIFQSLKHLKRNCPKNNHKKSKGFVKKDDQPSSSGSIYNGCELILVMSAKVILDWIMDS